MKEDIIKISGNPELLKTLVLGTGKAIVEIDTLDNDYTRTCSIGDIIIVEPSHPPISATRRYMLWYGDRLIYSKIKKTRKNTKWIILGIGEVNINDVKFWCNAKKKPR
jgi:hypothetical protein